MYIILLINILIQYSTLETILFVAMIFFLICLCFGCIYFLRNYYIKNSNIVNKGEADIEIIDTKLDSYIKNKKIWYKISKIFLKILSWLLLTIVLVGFGFSLASRITNNTMLLGNTSYVVIASGSMEHPNSQNTYIKENNLTNQIKTYDIVGIDKITKKEDIKLYDIIAFKDKNNRTIVHRVVEIKDDYTFVTKGDANINFDSNNLYNSSLSFENIIGKYNGKHVHYLGMFIIFLQSNMGIATVISLIICLVSFDFFKSKYYKVIETRENLLFKKIGFIDEKNKFKIKKECIVYQDKLYEFDDDKFIKKIDNNDNTLPPFEKNEMLVITYDNIGTRIININKIEQQLNLKSLNKKE